VNDSACSPSLQINGNEHIISTHFYAFRSLYQLLKPANHTIYTLLEADEEEKQVKNTQNHVKMHFEFQFITKF